MSSSPKIVFLFSGQGSQYRGMGEKLFKNNSVFRKSIEESNTIVQRHLNRCLIDELYGKSELPFDDVLITHPAIVAVEVAMYAVMQSLNITPHYVTGNSLGEFAAAVASGFWSAETAMEAAVEQAKCIVRTNAEGTMMAVVSERSKNMEELYAKHNLYLASDNFDGHFTLSGAVQPINLFQSALQTQGISFFRLPVSFPFHSPLIDGAKNGFNYFMNHVPLFAKSKTSFISGIKAKEMNCLCGNYFWEAASQYSNFKNVVEYIETKGTCLYIDLGPAGTAANFVKYNLKPSSNSTTIQIMNLYKREEEQLGKLLAMSFEQ